jgi:hypothetical protein
MTRSCRHGPVDPRVAGGTLGGFRRRGARSGDAVRRPDAPPRRARLRAAEPVVDRGSLFPATDGPHGMMTTNADVINADILAFIKGTAVKAG